MMSIFNRSKKIRNAAHSLFTDVVKQARRPKFYADWGVADTLDGRFDLIILHVSLVINRLESQAESKATALLIRYLQEVLFDNMDMSLREIGVGDMGVGKKVKIMAEAYYGRKLAYKRAINSDDSCGQLKLALTRNIYRGQPPEQSILGHFGRYIECQIKCLGQQTDDELMSGKLFFDQ